MKTKALFMGLLATAALSLSCGQTPTNKQTPTSSVFDPVIHLDGFDVRYQDRLAFLQDDA